MSFNYYTIKSQWDPWANDHPFPDDPQNNKHVVGKWKCERGHFWYETIENRAYYQNCHSCHSHKRASETYNIFYLRPDIAAMWHQTKNNGLTPDVTPGSHKIVNWKCKKVGHKWKTEVRLRTIRGSGCPNCYNDRRKRKL
jgi:Zn finger protein HypA/HybF involved in hydrogenase expression